jgi:hypothetical protein
MQTKRLKSRSFESTRSPRQNLMILAVLHARGPTSGLRFIPTLESLPAKLTVRRRTSRELFDEVQYAQMYPAFQLLFCGP